MIHFTTLHSRPLLQVAIVGDIHGAWNPRRDAAALRLLSPDVTLLVGDFGNEHVELVRLVGGGVMAGGVAGDWRVTAALPFDCGTGNIGVDCLRGWLVVPSILVDFASFASLRRPCSAERFLVPRAQIASLDLPKAVILGNHDAWVSSIVASWGLGESKTPDATQCIVRPVS